MWFLTRTVACGPVRMMSERSRAIATTTSGFTRSPLLLPCPGRRPPLHKIGQVVQVRADAVRRDPQLLDGRPCAVDPEGRVTEGAGPRGIPATEGRERDLIAGETEG